jgi:hypothetical protein
MLKIYLLLILIGEDLGSTRKTEWKCIGLDQERIEDC